jgi:hypothetical protein
MGFDELASTLASKTRRTLNVETVGGMSLDPSAYGYPSMTRGFGVPAYKEYEAAEIFPYKSFILMLLPGIIVLYTEAKFFTGWGTCPRYFVDIALAIWLIGQVLDMIVTINGTYVGHQRGGFEGNPTIRQFVEHFERLGWTFAQGMLLLEGFELLGMLITWYYARRQRNMFWCLMIAMFGLTRFFLGFRSWPQDEGLLDLQLFWRQLTGLTRKYQGGGPQMVVTEY